MNKEELEQEIIELNKDIEFRQKVIDSLCETKKMYRDRIDKAIEYMETRYIDLEYTKNNIGLDNVTLEIKASSLYELLSILKGNYDKE